jgi:hypothetical protein
MLITNAGAVSLEAAKNEAGTAAPLQLSAAREPATIRDKASTELLDLLL